MLQSSAFLSPKLTGKRFNDHLMPLDLLEDFSALEDLLQAVAKKIYLHDNPGKTRVPRKFTESVSLKLASIEAGSVIPNILLALSTLIGKSGAESEISNCYNRAKMEVLAAIDAANRDEQIVSEFIDKDDLTYFSKIGRRLRDDEAIDFAPNSEKFKAVLNISSRKKLLKASEHSDVESIATIRASVSSLNKEKGTFTLVLVWGGRLDVSALVNPHFFSVFKDAFEKYEDGRKIIIDCVAKFDKSDRVYELVNIDEVSELDPLDVPTRLWELSTIPDGWYDGDQGKSFNKRALKKFSSMFEAQFDPELPMPHIYPTLNGGIQAEWSTAEHEISLEVDIETLIGTYHEYNVSNDTSEEYSYELEEDGSWDALNEILKTKLPTI